jgi:hypothetical protein
MILAGSRHIRIVRVFSVLAGAGKDRPAALGTDRNDNQTLAVIITSATVKPMATEIQAAMGETP